MSAYQVFVCPTCACKRRIYKTRGGKGLLYFWACSQGHTWTTEVPTVEKIVETLKLAFLENVSTLFNRDSPFLREMRRR